MMCKLGDKCGSAGGFCGHEKMMMLVAMLAALGAVGHWGLKWF